jgi:hypothetical protein
MKNFHKHILFFSISICTISCTVTNNLYINNPIPMGKGEREGYVGLGTGIAAKIDSISSVDGAVNFSNKISIEPVLSVGGQMGISKQTDLRIALHFPGILFTGLGLRAGLQHSFCDTSSRINIALGTDLGFVISDDTVKILGTKFALDSLERASNGAINADFFLPVSYKIKNNFIVVLTPRYSFNVLYIEGIKSFKLGYPALSLGVRVRKFYFETTALYYHSSVYGHLGVAYLIH